MLTHFIAVKKCFKGEGRNTSSSYAAPSSTHALWQTHHHLLLLLASHGLTHFQTRISSHFTFLPYKYFFLNGLPFLQVLMNFPGFVIASGTSSSKLTEHWLPISSFGGVGGNEVTSVAWVALAWRCVFLPSYSFLFFLFRDGKSDLSSFSLLQCVCKYKCMYYCESTTKP